MQNRRCISQSLRSLASYSGLFPRVRLFVSPAFSDLLPATGRFYRIAAPRSLATVSSSATAAWLKGIGAVGGFAVAVCLLAPQQVSAQAVSAGKDSSADLKGKPSKSTPAASVASPVEAASDSDISTNASLWQRLTSYFLPPVNAPHEAVNIPLPIDKLACRVPFAIRPSASPHPSSSCVTAAAEHAVTGKAPASRTPTSGTTTADQSKVEQQTRQDAPIGQDAQREQLHEHRPVVLVACGSFNPPTVAHLRMFELANDALTQAGYDVLGGYLSPVNDAYGKPGLAPARHRLQMCQLAALESTLVMVDPWEAAQPANQRSLWVLQRVQQSLQALFSGTPQPGGEVAVAGPGGGLEAEAAAVLPQSAGAAAAPDGAGLAPVRVMLLCGADLIESFLAPGVWREDHLRAILADHGVICITRDGSDVEPLLAQPGSTLHQLREHVHVVTDPVPSSISSTKVRQQIAQGRSVRYLVPDAVIMYIKAQRLYTGSGN